MPWGKEGGDPSGVFGMFSLGLRALLATQEEGTPPGWGYFKGVLIEILLLLVISTSVGQHAASASSGPFSVKQASELPSELRAVQKYCRLPY